MRVSEKHLGWWHTIRDKRITTDTYLVQLFMITIHLDDHDDDGTLVVHANKISYVCAYVYVCVCPIFLETMSNEFETEKESLGANEVRGQCNYKKTYRQCRTSLLSLPLLEVTMT